MSVRRSNNQQKFKSFCVFCKNAGKSVAEYTNHYPKDKPGKDGKVICPTILSTECSYCHELGHAKNHCPKLKHGHNMPRRKTRCGHKSHSPNNGRNYPLKEYTVNIRKMTGKIPQKIKQSIPVPKAEYKNRNHGNKFQVLENYNEGITIRNAVVFIPQSVVKQQLHGAWKMPLRKSAVSKPGTEKKAPVKKSVHEVLEKLNNEQPIARNWGDMLDSDSESDEDDW
jgi:hypothetical protein